MNPIKITKKKKGRKIIITLSVIVMLILGVVLFQKTSQFAGIKLELK